MAGIQARGSQIHETAVCRVHGCDFGISDRGLGLVHGIGRVFRVLLPGSASIQRPVFFSAEVPVIQKNHRREIDGILVSRDRYPLRNLASGHSGLIRLRIAVSGNFSNFMRITHIDTAGK